MYRATSKNCWSCGRVKVWCRNDDKYICAVCGYTWTVEIFKRATRAVRNKLLFSKETEVE